MIVQKYLVFAFLENSSKMNNVTLLKDVDFFLFWKKRKWKMQKNDSKKIYFCESTTDIAITWILINCVWVTKKRKTFDISLHVIYVPKGEKFC